MLRRRSRCCWNEVDAWIEAARVAQVMFHNRLGLMGHYYGGMLDIYSDITLQCATFGGHMEILEVDELAALRRGGERRRRSRPGWRNSRRSLTCRADCPPAELERAARTSLALDRLVAEHDLGSLAYYYIRHRQRRKRGRHQFHHPGQFAADRARHARGRRIRGQKRPGHEDHGHLRRGRFLHRILRHGFHGRRGADGARRPRATSPSPRAKPRCGR